VTADFDEKMLESDEGWLFLKQNSNGHLGWRGRQHGNKERPSL